MDRSKNQISRRDGLKLAIAGLATSPLQTSSPAAAGGKDSMTIRKVEIERFSLTSSKPFDDRGRTQSGHWATRYGRIRKNNEVCRVVR
jgi:hypothetical protein